MSVVIISGSGLIGAEAARGFAAQGLDVVGIDKDMRPGEFLDDNAGSFSLIPAELLTAS